MASDWGGWGVGVWGSIPTLLSVGGTVVPGPSLVSALQAHLWPALYRQLADEVLFIPPAPSLFLSDRLTRQALLPHQANSAGLVFFHSPQSTRDHESATYPCF